MPLPGKFQLKPVLGQYNATHTISRECKQDELAGVPFGLANPRSLMGPAGRDAENRAHRKRPHAPYYTEARNLCA